MHFHLPKPMHGWRAFAGEIAIIVIGVLIALTAEELVQRHNWQEEVTEARVALDSQLADIQFAALERVAGSDCTDRQLDRLDDLIDGATFPKVDALRVASIRLWGTSSWDAASSSGAVAHMSPELRNRYANLFSLASVMGELNRQEYQAMADFRTVKKHPRLTETSRDRLARDLAQVRSHNQLLTLGARQWLDSAKPLKLHVSKDDADALSKGRNCQMPDAPA